MKFWVYMVTVILSLPKSIVFVALGSPSSQNSKGVKWAKVVAIGVVVVITSEFSPSRDIRRALVPSLPALLIISPCSLRQYMDPQEDGNCYRGD